MLLLSSVSPCVDAAGLPSLSMSEKSQDDSCDLDKSLTGRLDERLQSGIERLLTYSSSTLKGFRKILGWPNQPNSKQDRTRQRCFRFVDNPSDERLMHARVYLRLAVLNVSAWNTEADLDRAFRCSISVIVTTKSIGLWHLTIADFLHVNSSLERAVRPSVIISMRN